MDNNTYVTDKGGVRRNILIHGVAVEGKENTFATDYALDHTLLAKQESGEKSIREHGSKYASSQPYFNQDADGKPVHDNLTASRVDSLERSGAEIVWNKDHTEFVGYANASFKESPKMKSADGRPMLYIDESTISESTRPFKASRFVTAAAQWKRVDFIASLQKEYEDSLSAPQVDVPLAQIEAPEVHEAQEDYDLSLS